ncbi:MAG: hypothetical protein IPL65_07400 [Lewinellaceae bacterium]|nr:hypothetical protein [Lewinellaceae bacterium]
MPWSSPTHGNYQWRTTTKADGSFEIQFPGPARSGEIPVKDQPVFDYTIYADVTDISSETRSGEQTLSIGYVALEVNLGLENANHLFLCKEWPVDHQPGWSTSGCHGEIKVQRLKSPDQLYAQRYSGKSRPMVVEGV